MITSGPRDPVIGQAPTFYYRAARDGFRDFLAKLSVSPGDKVLLPAFVGQSSREGSGVMDPLRDLGLTPSFYRINEDATTDVADFARLVAETPSAAVLIHYYGRTDPYALDVAELCRSNNVPLLEDAAHGMYTALCSESLLGKLGDAVIYSLHKMLPLPYGGTLRYRNVELPRPSVSPYPSLAHATSQYDLVAISKLRRSNFELATGLLKSSPGLGRDFTLLWPEIGTDVPQSLPLRIPSGGRDELYFRLKARGVGAVSLYHTLVPEIGKEYDRSYRLAREIINLPVHQDITPHDIQRSVREFESCLAELTHV